MQITAQSDVGKIEATIDRQRRQLNHYGRPDLARAIAESDRFVALLQSLSAEVAFLPRDRTVTMDSRYPRDAAIPTDKGVILCSMARKTGEPNRPPSQPCCAS